MKNPLVYMLASQKNGTIYIGVTSDLIKRVWQHKEELADGFTKKYGVKMLVWYEQHETMESAISKEKAMKKWLRKWKLSTIEQFNPGWIDLWPEILGETASPVIPANAGIQTAANGILDDPSSSVIPAKAGIQKGANGRLDDNPVAVIPAKAGIQTAANGILDDPSSSIIPAKAGIQTGNELDSRLRGNDGNRERGAGEYQSTTLDSRLRGNDGSGERGVGEHQSTTLDSRIRGNDGSGERGAGEHQSIVVKDNQTMQDIRWKQRFSNYLRAFQTLVEAVALAQTRELSKLEQQGLIQGFEFTHELAWNVLKDYLEDKGIIGLIGSKDATRAAFKNGLIEQGDDWMKMIQARNLTVHTYNSETAQKIVDDILERFYPAFDSMARKFTVFNTQQDLDS